MKHLQKIFVILCILGLAALVFFPFQIPGYRDFYNNVVLDNYDHWLPCDKLPTIAEVQRILEGHEKTARRIRNTTSLGAGSVDISIRNICADRGDLLIAYGSHEQRLKIEALLNEYTFFGVPVTLRNQ